MRYKLHPDVREAIPFDSTLLQPGPPQVIYDWVDVEETTDRPRTDRTFFCIDVEGTHNFVTTGGVVHNCRPPGNRDPKPDEISSCRPFLEQQIDLIAPKVIVTLGNFATKLLLDTTEGITRVRGRSYTYRSGATVVPTFHPSAALQGGGGDVVAKMRADLVRAKRALAGVLA
jgi:uracil-DNA glycosylase family 4